MEDEGEWIEAVSDKTKRKQKQQQKLQEARAAEEQAAKKNPSLKGTQKAPKEEAANEGKAAKAKAKAKAPKWDSADELVEVIRGIVAGVPFVDVAGVGTKLQNVTNHPWNKKFKPIHGSLGTFIKGYPKEFYVDENDRVYIRSEWAALERRRQEERAKKNKEEGKTTNNKKGANKKQVKPKKRCSLCCCLDFSSPFLLLILGLLYLTVCAMVLSQGNLHHSFVQWLTSKNYISAKSPAAAVFLEAGDVVKDVTARLLVWYQQGVLYLIKSYTHLRETSQTWRDIEAVFLLGLQTIRQGLGKAWDATIGTTSTGVTLENWSKAFFSSQAWNSVVQGWEKLLVK